MYTVTIRCAGVTLRTVCCTTAAEALAVRDKALGAGADQARVSGLPEIIEGCGPYDGDATLLEIAEDTDDWPDTAA